MIFPALHHYSASGVSQYQPFRSLQSNDAMKPRGLWLSDDNEYGWHEWCVNNKYGELTIRQAVTVRKDANILWIRNPDELRAFTREYGQARDPSFVRWRDVSAKYDGILITPYQWSLRLDHRQMWYYGWDCASACVWGDVIENISGPVPHIT